MHAIFSAIAPHITEIAVALLSAGVLSLRSVFTRWLNAKTSKTTYERAALVINDRVWDAVLEAEQVAVKTAKEHLASGALDAAGYKAMLAEIRSSVVRELYQKQLPELQELGAREVQEQLALLRQKVEAAVAEQRRNPRS